ncbi:MAG: helix-turn-helix domain-containing protein [Planctomycetes bacterium]|nr:helix-turn-helix domain-containing protein [Planctomycetota bacterium]
MVRTTVSPERVKHLREQGLSLRAIGKHLGVGKSTVSRLLVRAG